MPLDFYTAPEPVCAPNAGAPAVSRRRKARGEMAHARGCAAEAQIARHYTDKGQTLLHARWRGTAGELDLILKDGDEIICVEVKSSRTHATAAESLSTRQILRLMQTAEEFIGTQPLGSLTPMRLDVALVDNQGQIDILENALMAL